jgi:hypothetical protein
VRSTSELVRYWKDAPSGEVHDFLIPTVRETEERQMEIHQLNLRCAKLYSNRELMTLDWGTGSIREVMHRPASMQTENLCASAVETLYSFIGKNRPKATIVTHDGSFEQRRSGELLDRAIYGEFLFHNVWEKAQLMFRDACVFGTGFLRVDVDPTTNELFIERVLPDEVIVDQRECVSGCEPQQLHIRRVVSRHVLLEMYGDDPKAELALAEAKSSWISYRNPANDYLVVVESWWRGPNGRHAICVDGATLLDEKYERTKFPLVKLCYREPLTGFYGSGVVELAMPYQLRMNRLNWTIEKGQDLFAKPWVFFDAASQMIRQQFDNEIDRAFYFRGQPPVVQTWPGASPEMYAERAHIREQCWSDLGLNQLQISGQLPSQARMDSSKAIREVNNIHDERHAPVAQRYERAMLDIAEHMVELGAKAFKGRTTTWRNGKVTEAINWDAIDLSRDRYTMVVEASSILNMTPAARQDQVDNWANKGWLTPEEARAMVDHPDLEASTSLTTAAVKNIEWTIQQLQNGVNLTPDPLQHLEYGVARVQMAYLDAQRQGADDAIVLEPMRRWIELANHILNPPQDTVLPAPGAQGPVNPSPEAQAAMGMPPGGMPMPGAGLDIPVGPTGAPVPSVATTSGGTPVTMLP